MIEYLSHLNVLCVVYASGKTMIGRLDNLNSFEIKKEGDLDGKVYRFIEMPKHSNGCATFLSLTEKSAQVLQITKDAVKIGPCKLKKVI